MGLLDRARVLDNDEASIGMGDPSAEARRIISSFRHSPEHLDFPKEFFEAFRRILGFSHGALLFPDTGDGEFYPWIISGLDRTSSRRLRLPADFPQIHLNKSDPITAISPDILAPMLSNREHGLAKSVLLVRIGKGEAPSALILALDSPENIDSSPGITSAVRILNNALSEGIAKNRKPLETADNDEPVDPAEWLGSWGDREAVLVILDTSPAIDGLMETIGGLEPYRAKRDVVALIRRITGRMGRICDMKDGRVLVLFPAERLPDRDLYLHQLSNAIAASVLDLPSPPLFPAEFHSWPEEKDAVKAALSGFFTE